MMGQIFLEIQTVTSGESLFSQYGLRCDTWPHAVEFPILFSELILMMTKLVFGLTILVVLTGCASTPLATESTPQKAEVHFIDLPSFDRNLGGSLAAQLPQVSVAFYDHIAPSALPARLQIWMAAVETGGGTVKVVPPKSSVTAKGPLLLISAISALWSASKTVQEVSARAQFRAAQAYDAQIMLRTDEQGQTLVDRVVFTQRSK